MDKHSDSSKIKQNATPITVELNISENLEWTKSHSDTLSTTARKNAACH